VSYLLHVSGPASFEQVVALQPGKPAVIVGRDPEAAVYLPDTERLISRRHLEIDWIPDGARIKVLSPNGVTTDRGEYFQGDEVSLADGESGKVGSFTFIVSAAPAADSDLDATSFAGMGTRPLATGPSTRTADSAEEDDDPWGALTAKAPATQAAEQFNAAITTAVRPDDPFSAGDHSWGAASGDPFSATGLHDESLHHGDVPHHDDAPIPGVDAPVPGGGGHEKLALQSLFRGLGVPVPATMTGFDWERFGGQIRLVVQCLADHIAARSEGKQDMRAEDRTMLGNKQAVNPLKGGAMPVKDMLQYLLVAADGAGGTVPANQGLHEMAEEARGHEAAMRRAAKRLAEGALKEFDPARLREQLLKGKLSMTALVDNARLWDLYTTHYEARAGDKLPEWADQLFNRYFMAAYLRETERARRAAIERAQGGPKIRSE
jgi:type VI secretion system FHA domain protein